MERVEALKIWDAIFGNNTLWAKDCFGTWMYREDYGKTETVRVMPNTDGKKYHFGWEIDHIRPKSSFENEKNADFLNNYEPMHWQNNRDKADAYPHFIIDEEQYRVVKCRVCSSNGFHGYGIINQNDERVDWKGRMGKYFPTNN